MLLHMLDNNHRRRGIAGFSLYHEYKNARVTKEQEAEEVTKARVRKREREQNNHPPSRARAAIYLPPTPTYLPTYPAICA